MDINVKVTLDATPTLTKVAELLAEVLEAAAFTITNVTPDTNIMNDTPETENDTPDIVNDVPEDNTTDVDPDAGKVAADVMRAATKDKPKAELKAILDKYGYVNITTAAASKDGEEILAAIRGL